MKVLIIGGGRGSIPLQEGLHALGINYTVLINMYDDGLSSGTVRRHHNWKVLGPSDLRKNHHTWLRLNRPDSPWLKWLEARGQFANEQDFSYANFFYAQVMRLFPDNFPFILAEALDIPKEAVIVNNLQPFNMWGKDVDGNILNSEDEIVSGRHRGVAKLFFTHKTGVLDHPGALGPAPFSAITNADLIILAPGTQWSSHIPTYLTKNFDRAVQKSKARIVLVPNLTPDLDWPDYTVEAHVNLLKRWFPMDRLEVIHGEPSVEDPRKHDGHKLAQKIIGENSK